MPILLKLRAYDVQKIRGLEYFNPVSTQMFLFEVYRRGLTTDLKD